MNAGSGSESADAVAQDELGQDPADVDLHGALGDVQAGCDFAVGHACGDESEDVLLAASEGAAYLLVAAGRRFRAEPGAQPPAGRVAHQNRIAAKSADALAHPGQAPPLEIPVFSCPACVSRSGRRPR